MLITPTVAHVDGALPPSPPSAHAQIAAVVVHQLRNRISRVLFGADAVLAATAEHPDLAKTAQRLRRGVDELIASFDQLIEIARFLGTDAAERLRPEQVDVAAMAVASTESALQLLHARGHSMALELPGGPVWLEVDRIGLDLVYENLISNAAKYTPGKGAIAIRISQDDGEVRITVKDSGIGLPPDVLAELQAPPSPSSGPRAGLALTRRIVELHGGTLRAHSDGPGKGSELTVVLPLRASARAPGDTTTPRALLVGERSRPLSALLRGCGYVVDTALPEECAGRAGGATVILVPLQIAAGDPGLVQRLRDANGNAQLVLLGEDGAVPDGFDRVLPKALDADTLQAVLAAG